MCVCVCPWREKPQKYEGLYKTAPPGIFKSQDSLYAQPPAITQHYQIVQPVAASIGFYLQYAALGYDSLYSCLCRFQSAGLPCDFISQTDLRRVTDFQTGFSLVLRMGVTTSKLFTCRSGNLKSSLIGLRYLGPIFLSNIDLVSCVHTKLTYKLLDISVDS